MYALAVTTIGLPDKHEQQSIKRMDNAMHVQAILVVD